MRDFHRHALTVALLITAERQQRGSDKLEYSAHTVVSRYFEKWADEKKADLYALMAENINPTDGLTKMQKVISDCLYLNEKRFPN